MPIVAAALLLGSCGTAVDKSPVTDAWVQLPAASGRPGAAYFTLNGGKADVRLMELSSPQVVRIELHESMMKDGMMTMAPIAGGIAIPAGAHIAFAPGGKHAMLFDVDPAVKPGSAVTLRFAYADGKTIEVAASAKAPGSAEGSGGGHAH